jgi:hypothetical protein
MDAEREALVQEFVRALDARREEWVQELDALDSKNNRLKGMLADEFATSRIVAAVTRDSKFRDSWADPEFQETCRVAVLKHNAGGLLRSTLERKKLRTPDDEMTIVDKYLVTEAEARELASQCGLTEEDVDRIERETDLKLFT